MFTDEEIVDDIGGREEKKTEDDAIPVWPALTEARNLVDIAVLYTGISFVSLSPTIRKLYEFRAIISKKQLVGDVFTKLIFATSTHIPLAVPKLFTTVLIYNKNES